ANEQRLQRVYVVAPRGSDPALSHRTEFRLWVEDLSNGDRVHKDTIFNGVDR
ncbi:MAG: cytochrome c oxidase accessory protein CcoG, partial [Pseudomonadota bacterium]